MTVLDGALTVDAAPLQLTVNDAAKTYGSALAFDGTEFAVTGGELFFDDSVDSLAIASAGAAAQAEVAGSPYAITGGAPLSGTRIGNYDVTVLDGALTVDAAPLVVTPDEQEKTEGGPFVFAGTEFSTRGLLFSDTVTRVNLSSDGADAQAAATASPFDIRAQAAQGDGLENYRIVYESGTLTVTAAPQEDPVVTPVPTPFFDLPNPNDTIVLSLFGEDNTGGIAVRSGTGGPANNAVSAQARETLATVQGISSTLEIASASCSESSGNVDRYLACLSDALDDFANELDAISTELPPGMEGVARIVRDARQNVAAARTRASARLAGATSQAERDAITREAVGEAREALSTAATEIRKAISFVRADDPELASIQRATITTVAAAVDSVGIELSRATGL